MTGEVKLQVTGIAIEPADPEPAVDAPPPLESLSVIETETVPSVMASYPYAVVVIAWLTVAEWVP
jgi:hypothetical protein